MRPSELVQRCQSGDRAAWRTLVDEYGGIVYAIARAHRFDESTCDDIAQVVFGTLAQSISKLAEPAALPGWLTTTARRECWRLMRASRRDRETRESAPRAPEIDADRIDNIERAAHIRHALTELGGRCQALLTALFLCSGSPDYQAIARSQGLPVGSIGPTRARCLAKLATILDAKAVPGDDR